MRCIDRKKDSVWREGSQGKIPAGLTQTQNPKEDVDIFNIFGHTPVENINLNQHFLNIDTGCTYGLEENLGELSAYCLQTGEVVQQKRVR